MQKQTRMSSVKGQQRGTIEYMYDYFYTTFTLKHMKKSWGNPSVDQNKIFEILTKVKEKSFT